MVVTIISSLDSSPGATGHTPNNSDGQLVPPSPPHMGTASAVDCESSPEEFVFPWTVKTAPTEGADGLSAGGGPVFHSTLPDLKHLEEWVLAKLFPSDATTTTTTTACPEYILDKKWTTSFSSILEDASIGSLSSPLVGPNCVPAPAATSGVSSGSSDDSDALNSAAISGSQDKQSGSRDRLDTSSSPTPVVGSGDTSTGSSDVGTNSRSRLDVVSSKDLLDTAVCRTPKVNFK